MTIADLLANSNALDAIRYLRRTVLPEKCPCCASSSSSSSSSKSSSSKSSSSSSSKSSSSSSSKSSSHSSSKSSSSESSSHSSSKSSSSKSSSHSSSKSSSSKSSSHSSSKSSSSGKSGGSSGGGGGGGSSSSSSSECIKYCHIVTDIYIQFSGDRSVGIKTVESTVPIRQFGGKYLITRPEVNVSVCKGELLEARVANSGAYIFGPSFSPGTISEADISYADAEVDPIACGGTLEAREAIVLNACFSVKTHTEALVYDDCTGELEYCDSSVCETTTDLCSKNLYYDGYAMIGYVNYCITRPDCDEAAILDLYSLKISDGTYITEGGGSFLYGFSIDDICFDPIVVRLTAEYHDTNPYAVFTVKTDHFIEFSDIDYSYGYYETSGDVSKDGTFYAGPDTYYQEACEECEDIEVVEDIVVQVKVFDSANQEVEGDYKVVITEGDPSTGRTFRVTGDKLPCRGSIEITERIVVRQKMTVIIYRDQLLEDCYGASEYGAALDNMYEYVWTDALNINTGSMTISGVDLCVTPFYPEEAYRYGNRYTLEEVCCYTSAGDHSICKSPGESVCPEVDWDRSCELYIYTTGYYKQADCPSSSSSYRSSSDPERCDVAYSVAVNIYLNLSGGEHVLLHSLSKPETGYLDPVDDTEDSARAGSISEIDLSDILCDFSVTKVEMTSDGCSGITSETPAQAGSGKISAHTFTVPSKCIDCLASIAITENIYITADIPTVIYTYVLEKACGAPYTRGDCRNEATVTSTEIALKDKGTSGECLVFPLMIGDCFVYDYDDYKVEAYIRGKGIYKYPYYESGNLFADFTLSQLDLCGVSVSIESDLGEICSPFNLVLDKDLRVETDGIKGGEASGTLAYDGALGCHCKTKFSGSIHVAASDDRLSGTVSSPFGAFSFGPKGSSESGSEIGTGGYSKEYTLPFSGIRLEESDYGISATLTGASGIAGSAVVTVDISDRRFAWE